MKLQKLNPNHIIEPFNNAYHHSVVIPPNSRILHTSGQIGLRPDGSISDDPAEQADQMWFNLMACIEEAKMGPDDIVKITAYLVNLSDYQCFASARTKYLGDSRPASTAILVKGLVKPEWRFEVEAVAASAV